MNHPNRRLTAFLLALVLLLPLALSTTPSALEESAPESIPVPESTPGFHEPDEPEASLPLLNKCRAGGVCNGDTGEILFSVNETASMYPAAAVKLMTALLAIEHYRGKMDTVIVVTAESLSGASGVTVNLRAGEQLTARQLLACLVVGSANDAALVLARSIAGTLDAFVSMMNERADQLGMRATHYSNPTGLHHDRMVTTVADTLLLAATLYRRTEFTNLSSRATFEIPETAVTRERTINNRNYLISDHVVPDYYDPSVNGMCYGSTYEAGGVSVASSAYGGTHYIAVVFGGQTETVVTEEHESTDSLGNTIIVPEETKVIAHAFFEVKSLLDWAKKSFSYFRILTTADVICEIPVKLGSGRSHITLFPSEEIELYLPATADPDADIRTEYRLVSESLTAPISAGTVVGILYVYYRDALVGQVDLITRSSVDQSILDYYAEEALDFLSSPAFRTFLLTLTAILAVYALLMSIWRHRMRKKALLRRRREQDEQRRALERAALEQVERRE